MSAYEKAVFYAPDNPAYLNNYAYLLANRNLRLDRALEMAKRALEEEPENENFLDTVGWIYFKLEDYDRALQYIRRSVAIGGASADVIGHLGDVQKATGDIVSARESYERALRIDPENRELRKKLDGLK
jgi:tetratricopeptide (TPR) repeat protein